MSERCVDCGEITVWEQEFGSSICTHCGTLSNPSQSVLASHLESQDTSGYEYPSYLSNTQTGTTLKGRNGWTFAGQDKEARNKRNMVSMHEFINSVLSKLSNPGLVPRTQNLFDQAMRTGNYRWGRKAKVIAGACVAIALREARKSDSFRDIAFLLDESHTAVARSFMSIVQLLGLPINPADPSVHLRTLQTHLQSLMRGQTETVLPPQLLKVLSPLMDDLHAVIRTASALSAVVVRLDNVTNLPTPPTACAILMLSLEGELSTSFPNAGALAQALGTRIGVSKKPIMERYKTIYDAVEEWIREVPWLDSHEKKSRKVQSREASGGSSWTERCCTISWGNMAEEMRFNVEARVGVGIGRE